MYVLDSSVLIDLVKKTQRWNDVTAICKEEEAITTSICLHEVLVGAETSHDISVFETIFAEMKILEHTIHAAKIGALIEQQLVRLGTKINSMDILIAAICRAYDATLITSDKDFLKIKDLKVKLIN